MTEPKIIDESASIENLAAIWETELPTTGTHALVGWSVERNKLVAILGRDGTWHDVTPTPADETEHPDPD